MEIGKAQWLGTRYRRQGYEVRMATSRKKRKCLLRCARKRMELYQVNRELDSQCLDPIHQSEWALWENYYEPFVRNNPFFESELLEQNRSLAWFAQQINERKKKIILS
jgi:hypothetical protein